MRPLQPTWSKSGIKSLILVRMNLDELEPYEALDVLEIC
jgi:hypothetical protein